MKNLYQQDALHEIIFRLQTLKPDNQKQWGKMSVAQMMAHCTNVLEMATGAYNPPRSFIGRVLGPIFKPVWTNDEPFRQSTPTDKKFVITGEHDFNKERELLIENIKEFNTAGPEKCTMHPHPFFGKLTSDEWGIGMYKHLDHHLQQFSA